MELLFWLGALFVMSLYFQVISVRDKRDRKKLDEMLKLQKQEQKRRQREEKLKAKRIKHPKVCYLDDYRQSAGREPKNAI